VTLRASYVVRDRSQDGAPVVLWCTATRLARRLDRPLRGEAWRRARSIAAAELARATELPLALVTDGQRWTLVWARQGESTGSCTWRAELWLEKPVTLRAFVTLLGARGSSHSRSNKDWRHFLADSAGRQQEVADQLGTQVRHAVELLIATLDAKTRNATASLLANLEGAEASAARWP